MTNKGRPIESLAIKSDSIYGAHKGTKSYVEGPSSGAKVPLKGTHRMQNSGRQGEFLHGILVGRVSALIAPYAYNTHRRGVGCDHNWGD